MIDNPYYISEPYRGDPNAPTCQACGAVMVRFDSFGKWVCMSCGEQVDEKERVRA
jgi:ribosomal protein L37AE/L43A